MHYNTAFYHGWACLPAIWDEIVHELSGIHFVYNRGYVSQQNTFPEHAELDTLVTHSLGLHFAYVDGALQKAKRVVVLNGFLSFTPKDIREARIVRSALKAMKNACGTTDNCAGMLQSFFDGHESKGLLSAHQLSDEVCQSLAEDLEFLEQHVIPIEAFKGKELTVACSELDTIVSDSIGIENEKNLSLKEVLMFKGAGHFLPYTHAKQVRDLIIKG